MLRLKSDLLPALVAARDGQLKNFDLRWSSDAALTVVMAAKGYPGAYAKGTLIEGLAAAAQVEGVEIFHAGTTGGRRAHPRQWRPRAQCLRHRQNRARSAGARLSGGRPDQMAGRLLPPRYRLARGGAGDLTRHGRACPGHHVLL